MSNPYEVAGRMAKVMKILPILIRAKISADELAHASDSDWAMLHTALHLNHTSPETHALCIERLREFESGMEVIGG